MVCKRDFDIEDELVFFSPFQLKTDDSNKEVNLQFELTQQLSHTVEEAEKSYAVQDYPKTIELLSSVIEVR